MAQPETAWTVTDHGEDATARFYAANAQSYIDSTRHGTNPLLSPFLARLGEGARILELGCGAGRDALAMLQAGYDVDPTDGVPEIAAQAALLARRPVRVLRFEDLNDVAQYDAVWANASLLHVPRARLPDVLARIWTALKPGGLHFASYKSGTGEGLDRHGRFYNFPSVADLLAAYALPRRWDVQALVEYVEPGLDKDRPEPWIAITLRKFSVPETGAPSAM